MNEMNNRLKRAAEGVGLPISPRKMSYNSRLAHEVSKWAADLGKGEDFHLAVFHTLFVAGKNIARPEVLLEIASSLELPVHDQLGAVFQQRAAHPAGGEDVVKHLAGDTRFRAEHERLEDGREGGSDQRL